MKCEAKAGESNCNAAGSDSDTSNYSGGLTFSDRAKTRAKTAKCKLLEQQHSSDMDSAKSKKTAESKEKVRKKVDIYGKVYIYIYIKFTVCILEMIA